MRHRNVPTDAIPIFLTRNFATLTHFCERAYLLITTNKITSNWLQISVRQYRCSFISTLHKEIVYKLSVRITVRSRKTRIDSRKHITKVLAEAREGAPDLASRSAATALFIYI